MNTASAAGWKRGPCAVTCQPRTSVRGARPALVFRDARHERHRIDLEKWPGFRALCVPDALAGSPAPAGAFVSWRKEVRRCSLRPRVVLGALRGELFLILAFFRGLCVAVPETKRCHSEGRFLARSLPAVVLASLPVADRNLSSGFLCALCACPPSCWAGLLALSGREGCGKSFRLRCFSFTRRSSRLFYLTATAGTPHMSRACCSSCSVCFSGIFTSFSLSFIASACSASNSFRVSFHCFCFIS